MQRQNPSNQQQLQQHQQQQQIMQQTQQTTMQSHQEMHQQQRISRTEHHVQRSQVTTHQRGQSHSQTAKEIKCSYNPQQQQHNSFYTYVPMAVSTHIHIFAIPSIHPSTHSPTFVDVQWYIEMNSFGYFRLHPTFFFGSPKQKKMRRAK